MARSWDRSEGVQPRPARDVDIRYGHGLLKAESAKWPRYVAVSTPTAWKVAQPYIAKPPAGVGIVDMLGWAHLEDVSNSLPDDAELVVGVGGGVPLDASKYVALRKELPLILAPSIVSTGAIIHSMFAKWDGRHIVGDGDMPFCDVEHVVIDYDYALEAPEYLNTAGLGDVLCGFAGIAEWRFNAARGTAPPVDEDAVERALSYHHYLSDSFPKTLDSDGNLTPESIRFIGQAVQDRDDQNLVNPNAPGADHALMIVFELVADRRLVHGELTALGAVIVAWATGQQEELIDRLEKCRVRFRPTEIGITRDEFRQILVDSAPYLEGRAMDTILVKEPVVGERFDALWDYLEG